MFQSIIYNMFSWGTDSTFELLAAPHPTVHATTLISCHCQTERPDEANHRPSQGDRKHQPCSGDPGARGTEH